MKCFNTLSEIFQNDFKHYILSYILGTYAAVYYNTIIQQQNARFTSVDDFPKQVFAGQEVFGRTVPTSVTELVLTLLQRHVHAAADGLQHARVLADHTPLFVAQQRQRPRVHHHQSGCHGSQVVRFASFCDSPVGRKTNRVLTSIRLIVFCFIFLSYTTITGVSPRYNNRDV